MKLTMSHGLAVVVLPVLDRERSYLVPPEQLIVVGVIGMVITLVLSVCVVSSVSPSISIVVASKEIGINPFLLLATLVSH